MGHPIRGYRAGAREGGYTYLVLLFVIAIMGVAVAGIGTAWTTLRQREKEVELLFIGGQFRNAIQRYCSSSPAQEADPCPRELSDLLEDRRSLVTQRYLREIYVDPMTGSDGWGVIQAPTGGIIGVYSLSEGKPLKRSDFHSTNATFSEAKTYSDWKFLYDRNPGRPVPAK